MKKLGLMTDVELAGIFGHIDQLVPVHQGMQEYSVNTIHFEACVI